MLWAVPGPPCSGLSTSASTLWARYSTHWICGGWGIGLDSTPCETPERYLLHCECLGCVPDCKLMSVFSYLGMDGLIVLATDVFFVYGCIVFFYASMRASRTVHSKLISSLLGSTFRYAHARTLHLKSDAERCIFQVARCHTNFPRDHTLHSRYSGR